MDVEAAQAAVESVLREYVRARSNYKKDRTGSEWSQGMTIVSPDDKRIDEMARLVVEAVTRLPDQRPRIQVEVKSLLTGDALTYYATKNGLAVDEEVTVVRVASSGGRTTVKFRRRTDDLVEATFDSTYLVSVVRPSASDLRAMLEEV